MDWDAVENYCQQRYKRGDWRAEIFLDLIDQEMQSRQGLITLLDIGCGFGFDNSPHLQRKLIDAADRYIGIEPDPEGTAQEGIEIHRSPMEEANLEEGCVDVAFAVMVLEHVKDPQSFFSSVHRTLKPGGVFFGFTPNRTHYFAICSALMDTLRLKDTYLRLLNRSLDDHYVNFPTYYRCNSRTDLAQAATDFHDVRIAILNRVGQSDYYLPSFLRPLGRLVDYIVMWAGLPGALIVCRASRAPDGSIAQPDSITTEWQRVDR